jgi:5-methylcytosine-specific restriction protein A
MSRTPPEWIAKNDDAKVPPRVRLRVFDRHDGRCHITGRKIQPGDAWDLDHVIALCNGGEHRENNMAPALRDKHREKTADDVALKSDAYNTRMAHLGFRPTSKRPIPGSRNTPFKKKMDGRVERRS